MRVIVNGEPRDVRSSSLADLVRELGLDGKPIAVERNRDLVARSRFDETQLREGDRLEIVHVVGGG